MTRAAAAPLAAIAAAVLAAPLHGQSHPGVATPYLPLGDPAYALIDALQARGELTKLPLLERPYTTGAVRAALARVDTAGRPAMIRSMVRVADRLARRQEPAASGADSLGDAALRFAVLVQAGGTGESSGRRDLLAADTSSAVSPFLSLRGAIGSGRVIAVARGLADDRLEKDPEFGGTRLRSRTARTEEGYVAAHWRFAELSFGRVARNWGPPTLEGLQLGSGAFTWEQLAARIGDRRVHLSAVVGRLDPYVAQGDSGTYQRFLAAHRLGGRWRSIEAAFSEAVLFGGIGRGFDWSYLNPLSIYQLAQFNEAGGSGNTNFALDLAARSRLGIVAAQLFVDDYQIDRCTPGCDEPASLGLTVSAEGVPLPGGQRAFASYTRVSNLTYRTPQPWERWTVNGVGIGRGTSDYDEWRAGVDLVLPTGPMFALPIRAYVARRRQGEGSLLAPYPTPEDYAATPTFLAGTPMHVTRAAVAATASTGGWLDLVGDLGWNRVSGRGTGAIPTGARLEGRVRLTVSAPPFALR